MTMNKIKFISPVTGVESYHSGLSFVVAHPLLYITKMVILINSELFIKTI